MNRTQLGRALRLPLREKGEVLEGVLEGLNFTESVEFVEGFLWNWVVLHDDDECVMVMPSEVLECGRLIREGCLEKVDWAGLVWSMVEREMRKSGLVKCYYASHLQLLIKVQHEELLREVPLVVVEDDEFEEHNIELSLGKGSFGKVELQREEVGEEQELDFDEYMEEPVVGPKDNVMQRNEVEGVEKLDFDEYKEETVFGLKGNVGEPLLRKCNANVNGLDCGEEEDEEGEQEEEEEEEVEDEHEVIPLEGMSSESGDIDHAMQAVQMPFSSGTDLNDNSAEDFISSQDDLQMISGPSFFVNGHERDIGLDYHNTLHSLNGSNKRLRIDNKFNAEPVDFDFCMEQIQHWMGKARVMYETKSRSCEDSTMNEQLLLNELQNRDNMIEHLRKAMLDESQKGQMNVYRLEKELFMVAELMECYRKALRETRKAFDEYRKQFPQADEPFYKDVPGSGGLVLSVVELENERLKQQEEERMKRLAIEKSLRDFEGGWIGKLEVHLSRIQSLGNRLLSVEDQIKLLHERNVKLKLSHPPVGAPQTGGLTAE